MPSKRTTKPKRTARPTGTDHSLREQLAYLLKGGGAHVHFTDALEKFPSTKRGAFAPGLTHSAWQLLEHMRIAQSDILEFCRNPKHVSPDFPEGYWPKSSVPQNDSEWSNGVRQFQHDLQAMVRLVEDPARDLYARIPHGTGQTLLREVLLLADHNSYHLGQLMDLRKALNIWPAD